MTSKGCDFCRGYKTVVWLGGITRPCPQCNGTGLVQIEEPVTAAEPKPVIDNPCFDNCINDADTSVGDDCGDDVDFIGDESSADDIQDVTPQNVLIGMVDAPKARRGRPAKSKPE